MLLPVLLHFLLDEAKGTIDDLLVEFKLGLFLVKVLLCALDFHRVEIQQLVLLLEDFKESLGLHSFMQDLILDATCQLDLFLILALQ